MADGQTCGLGLAEHAALPAKLAELTAFVADNLELHMRTLDVRDEPARLEHDAYRKLVAAHRDIAARLQATGEAMASYQDLPMGRHDAAAMSSPAIPEAFEKFVTAERELLALLEGRVEQDQAMLTGMGAAGSGRR